jgi:hypothetical protein
VTDLSDEEDIQLQKSISGALQLPMSTENVLGPAPHDPTTSSIKQVDKSEAEHLLDKSLSKLRNSHTHRTLVMMPDLKREVKEVLELPVSWGQYTSFLTKEAQSITKRIVAWLEGLTGELKGMPGEYPKEEDDRVIDQREWSDWR